MTIQESSDKMYQLSKAHAYSDALRSRIWQRLFACGLYYSGIAKNLYSRSIANGSTPWRILRYQHIITPETYSINLKHNQYVRPSTFEDNIKFLRDHFKVTPLPTLLDDIEAGKSIDPLTVCITIDKGWADAYSYAFPILYTHSMPATIFVSPAFIETTELFWPETVWLTMTALRNRNSPFPKLKFLSRTFYEDLAKLSPELAITDDTTALLIFLLEQAPIAKRESVYLELIDFAKAFGELPKFEAFISWKEAKEMQKSGLITFGSHGFSHKPLFSLSREEIADDLRNGFVTLSEQNLISHQLLAIPDDAHTSPLLATLGDLGLRFAMSHTSQIDIDIRKLGTLLFGRVSIFENIANCKEIFACQIFTNQGSEVKYLRRNNR